LAELMIVIVLGLLIGAAGLMAIETTRSSSAKTTARQEAVSQAELVLQRMTRETRQATQVLVAGPADPVRQLDLKTYLRPAGGGASTLRHVRWICNMSAASCTRADCGAAQSGTLAGKTCSGTQVTVIKGILTGTVFGAQLGDQPVTLNPNAETPALDFVTFKLVVALSDFRSGREAVQNLDPIELKAGVDLANL
jgi:hypothetical protein